MKYSLVTMSLSIFLISHTAFALAASTQEHNTQTSITDNWQDINNSLIDKGIEFNFSHKSDLLSVISGGIRRGSAWMGHTDIAMSLDFDKLLGMNTTTAYIHFISDLGNKFNRDYAGAFVGVDNIETSVNTGQLYHAWIQKTFANDSLSILTGLYPVDSEFYVTDSSGLFIQPPYGMANDFAQAGENGPPIFPLGALAIRVKYTSPNRNIYAQYALTDGVPGDPNNPHGTHIQLNKGDGTLSILELGLTPQTEETSSSAEVETFNKTAIGIWHYSSHFEDLDPSITKQHSSQGIYFLAERTLINEVDDPSQGLAGFIRFGTTNKDLYQSDWTLSTGLRYHGLIASRDDDIAGIAVTYNHSSEKFQRLNLGSANNQTQFEISYQAQVNNWLAIQPNLQYIINPNMNLDVDGNPTLDDVWIVGARVEVNF